MEVVPEFIADVGLKKGEKTEYAIVKDGEVQILIECKKSTEPVKIEHASQLFWYLLLLVPVSLSSPTVRCISSSRTSMHRTVWMRNHSSFSI